MEWISSAKTATSAQKYTTTELPTMPAPKLTAEQVRSARAEAETAEPGFYTRKARELGVSRSGLWQIVKGQRHKHTSRTAHRTMDPTPNFCPQSFRERILAKLSAA